MSDLKEFRDAIDSIEVTPEQKNRMYSNIIMKAEKPRRFSFPSLALKLAPVLSVCLIVVVTAAIILPNTYQSKEGSAGPTNFTPEYTVYDQSGKMLEEDEPTETYVIDGVECQLKIYRMTATNNSSSDGIPYLVFNASEHHPVISWTENDTVYVLSSRQVYDEASLMRLKDKLMQQLKEKP